MKEDIEDAISIFLEVADLEKTTMRTIYEKFEVTDRADKKLVKRMTLNSLVKQELKRLKKILHEVKIFKFKKETNLQVVQEFIMKKFGNLHPSAKKIRKVKFEVEMERELKNIE